MTLSDMSNSFLQAVATRPIAAIMAGSANPPRLDANRWRPLPGDRMVIGPRRRRWSSHGLYRVKALRRGYRALGHGCRPGR
jgi:hypothetical protein